jgi:XTP/dITP diphosphohydrolase
VRSRRWSGRLDLSASELEAANNALLVERMRGQPDRRARFVCAAAWCPGGGNGGEAVVVRGEVHGRIVDQPSGVHGFGYDAYFHSDELDRTLADATVDEKQQVSHRGRAFVALVDALRARGVAGGRGEFG